MSAVFLDTVGLLATWDASDQWHPAADAAFRSLAATHRTLVTSGFVLLECGNAAARRPYRQAVVRLREALLRTGSVLQPTPQELDEAWAAFDRGGTDAPGIVDHVSFVLMRRSGIVARSATTGTSASRDSTLYSDSREQPYRLPLPNPRSVRYA